MQVLARRLSKLGRHTLERDADGYAVRLVNRTYHSVVRLENEEQVARWYRALTGDNGVAERNPNRVGSLFLTKRDGLLVGGVDDEGMAVLVDKIKAARAVDKKIVFFLWLNEPKPGKKVAGSITVDVERDREAPASDSRVRSKPISGATARPGTSSALSGLFGKQKEKAQDEDDL